MRTHLLLALFMASFVLVCVSSETCVHEADLDTDVFAPTVTLTLAGAKKAMAAAAAEAEKNQWKVTIAITDAGGTPLMLHRLDGAAPFSARIALGKAETAAAFKKETVNLEKGANVAEGKARTSLLSSGFILMEGGVPIIVDGSCIGAVGVSGVLSSQDAQVAKAGVSSLIS